MKSQGLTLLEIMVALVIFAMTSTAIMKAAGDHLSSVGQIEDVTLATWVANNRLTQLQLENTWPPKTNQRGSADMSNRVWYWRQDVIATNDNDMRQITISVASDSNYENVLTSVSTFMSKQAKGAP